MKAGAVVEIKTVAADINSNALADLAARYAVETTEIDVIASSAKETISTGDFDALVNAVGPFQQFGPHIQKRAIEVGIDHVNLIDGTGSTQT